ncbi:MAG TPA: phosphoribosylformylglycinamidine synthase [Candidatus Ventrousia excrementavium]|uniref:Phosphoribosylformylglycinamidine synthase n=1 Tax=Candidatus Ventrousia excrementavium TaxID=2840961 RepID=A0A9D1IVZ4_9CLOT|nr:phosphoribosylformylglycinamidine synthase [Candidatus Ventrousia excrementavium]
MSNVYRCYTEKMPGFDVAAQALCQQLRQEEGIQTLEGVRILCRYDVQGIDEQTYELAKAGVFSEPAADYVYDEQIKVPSGARALIVEALPGQFDMRADSCSQCIALMTQGDRPLVRAATVYILSGGLTDADMDKVRKALINPVECREAAAEKPETLQADYPAPPDVAVLTGLTREDADLEAVLCDYGLAMDLDDLRFLQRYFIDEGRDPTLTELRMIDTYWSDHCRHTTFSTHLTDVDIQDPAVHVSYQEYLDARRELYGDKAEDRPVTLMDIATCGAKVLKKRGILKDLDESDEINACSVRITADVDGRPEPWLLMFKNETHNHPTEIEPFGGAATCLGGAIRDPLSGRAYVYQAMRVTGAGDPRTPLEETLPGKLPQRTICRKAAAGYSSYGNQIGLATGLVSEVYHEGYVAKRLETGAVVGAAPAENVVRRQPEPGDVVILLGGRTGRDGCGGATGSSKSHSTESLTECGAEVQKGNAPEERKIQRLFRNPEATRLIKRCNDFGAGGVSVAVGELADGLDIDLDRVPKKYDGLDGTELAISESQERMAVVLAPEDVAAFHALAAAENLESSAIAVVTEAPRLRMTWRGQCVCDIARSFLNSNGAKKSSGVRVPSAPFPVMTAGEPGLSGRDRALSVLSDLNVCLQKGLGTRFDGSIGASSVLMPFGGKNQLTPTQVMAAKLPVLGAETTTASVMAWGFDPRMMKKSPYFGAQASVVSSMARLVAAGADPGRVWLSLQEFFEKPDRSRPERLGKPFAALLGAFDAQLRLGAGAIGGKDSMSGSFNDLDVPPTLISFAITAMNAGDVLSPEFKAPNNPVYLFAAPLNADGTPDLAGVRAMWQRFHALCRDGRVLSAWALSAGGALEAVCKMAIGNDIGFTLDPAFDEAGLYGLGYGGLVAELTGDCADGVRLGVTGGNAIALHSCTLGLDEVKAALSAPLESTYPTAVAGAKGTVPAPLYTTRPATRHSGQTARPVAVIPAFPGTNCEYDTKRAIERAGGEGRIVLVRNMTPDLLKQSARELVSAISQAQMLIIPGGFSGGDEPDGSGKFIQALLRSPALTDAVHDLLHRRDGLALGICNGFQALIKLGLLPFGEIRSLNASCPTLTFNTIGRHQSVYAYTRVASVKSPWLSLCQPGEVHRIVFSHGEGRFMARQEMLDTLAANGQIALQYCDENGVPSMDIDVNINGSVMAIEGITSPDGRVLGKMGHSERVGEYVAKNIPGNKFQPLFEGGVHYFK